MDGVEESERGKGKLGDLEEDLPALTLGGLGAGAVGTEGNPVGYTERRYNVSLDRI